MDEVGGIDNKEIFNSLLAKKVLGEEKSLAELDEEVKKPDQLNENQYLSLKAALGSSNVPMGTSGTGKLYFSGSNLHVLWKTKNTSCIKYKSGSGFTIKITLCSFKISKVDS